MGGGCFAVDDASVAVFDGEAVVRGASAVDAGVEGDGRGVVGCGGVEGDDGGFAAVSPGGTVCGCVHACTLVLACGCLFDHGLWRERVSWLFAGVLCASVGDPCVCDGSEGLAGAQGDGGGVSALCAGISSLVVVEGCVDGDSAVAVRVARALALVRACDCARERSCALVRECASCEGEHAVCGGNDGFADQHVGERLLFAVHPFVDLGLCECYADGGERLVLVAWGGEGAGCDVGVACADGGGYGFALVEEDEGEAGDGACVAHVGVEVCALDDAPVGFRAHRLNTCVLVAVVCARRVGGYTSGVAAECDGEVGAVAECDDVSVVALHVAAVEELVEGGGELVCVADGVLCGARWSKAVFDVVPRVHCWFLFLSVASCLFFFVYAGCALSTARVWMASLFTRVFLFVMVSWQCCCWQSMIVGGYCGRFRAW